MKTYLYKLHNTTCSILCLITLLTCLYSCSDDDDEKDEITGYWVPLVEARENARLCITEDWVDDDGGVGGIVSFNFINHNTVEKFMSDMYVGAHSNAYYEESVLGKTISFVKNDVATYTYVIKDGKIYITSGDIGTIINGELRIDDLSFTFQKIK